MLVASTITMALLLLTSSAIAQDSDVSYLNKLLLLNISANSSYSNSTESNAAFTLARESILLVLLFICSHHICLCLLLWLSPMWLKNGRCMDDWGHTFVKQSCDRIQ
jgi:hypothetical protein